MAQASEALPVKLVIGVLFSEEDALAQAKKHLQKRFGLFDFQSGVLPFNYTKYYESRMGPNLKRQFFSVERLVTPERLADIKLYTNKLEEKLSRKDDANKVFPRRINLDPGYICAAKLVLATCKDYSHRLYLGKGIYAEVTLQYRGNGFMPQEWTYPDYRSKEYIEIFQTVRALYMKRKYSVKMYRSTNDVNDNTNSSFRRKPVSIRENPLDTGFRRYDEGMEKAGNVFTEYLL